MNKVEVYERFVWPVLETLPANVAHERVIELMEQIDRYPWMGRCVERFMEVEGEEQLRVEFGGMTIDNPLFLAAGFDKDGRAIRMTRALGFGGMEVGSVLRFKQAGSEWPSIVRTGNGSLVNRMGFPSLGVEFVKQNIEEENVEGFALGVNVGVNRDRLEKMALDYARVVESLYKNTNFFVLNFSSPNTVGLREIGRDGSRLEEVIIAVKEVMSIKGAIKPVFIKISPDETKQTLDTVVRIAIDNQMAGLVATNTSVNEGIRLQLGEKLRLWRGGVSGAAIEELSTAVIEYLRNESGGQLGLIGSGGVMDFRSAVSKLRAGADVLEIYTGLVYKGPGIVSWLKAEILSYMEHEGLSSWQELVASVRENTKR